MKQPPTQEDRLWRLKLRLGWRQPKFRTRIRPGGWMTLPPALGVKAGDQWAIESIGSTLVLRRIDPQKHHRRKPIQGKSLGNLATALTRLPDVGTDDDFARAADETQRVMLGTSAAVDIQASTRDVGKP